MKKLLIISICFLPMFALADWGTFTNYSGLQLGTKGLDVAGNSTFTGPTNHKGGIILGNVLRTTWPSSGASAWGDLTGSISNQTDLQNELDAKLGTTTAQALYVAISSLSDRIALIFAGTSTDALSQGATNKYWSNDLFDTRLFASTSLPKLATLNGLSTIGSSTGQTNILGQTIISNASSTNQTIDALYITGNASALASFDQQGKLISTTTPTGSSQWTTNGNDIYYNTGNVGIGSTTPITSLVILGNNTVSAGDYSKAATVQSYASSTAGIGDHPAFSAMKLASSTNAGVGIDFHLLNASNQITRYADIWSRIEDNTAGAENGSLKFGVRNGGASAGTAAMTIMGTSGVVGVGIGTSTPLVKLVVDGGTATSTVFITSKTKGGALILKDESGGGCTGISTKAGTIISKVIACPE